MNGSLLLGRRTSTKITKLPDRIPQSILNFCKLVLFLTYISQVKRVNFTCRSMFNRVDFTHQNINCRSFFKINRLALLLSQLFQRRFTVLYLGGKYNERVLYKSGWPVEIPKNLFKGNCSHKLFFSTKILIFY